MAIAETKAEVKELKIVPVNLRKAPASKCEICGERKGKLDGVMTSSLIVMPPVCVVFCMGNQHCHDSAAASVQTLYAERGCFLYDTPPKQDFNLKRSDGTIENNWHIVFARKSKSKKVYQFEMCTQADGRAQRSLDEFAAANPGVDICALMPKLPANFPKKAREDMEAAFAKFASPPSA